MNYFRNSIKKRSLLVTLSSFLMMIGAVVVGNHNKSIETKADHLQDKAYIGIDSSKGIGYLSPTLENFMQKLNYHCIVDLTSEREKTIFLQNEWQGSEQFLGDIKTVQILDNIYSSNYNHFFAGLENLEEIVGLSNLKSFEITKFNYMFEDTPKLKSIDLKDFDVSMCADLSYMFAKSSFESLDFTGFDTSSCGCFEGMFSECKAITNLDLSSFDTRLATDMEAMFQSCSSLEYLDISSFDLSKNPRTEYFFRHTDPKIIFAPKVVPEHRTSGDNVIEFWLQQFSMDPVYYYDKDLNNYETMKASNKSITYYNDQDIKLNVEGVSNSCRQPFEDYEDLTNLDVDELRDKWEVLSDFDISTFLCKEDCDAVFTILKECSLDTQNEAVGKWITLYEQLYLPYCHALVDYGGDFLGRCPNALLPDGLVHLGVDVDEKIGYISNVDSYEILKSDVKGKYNLSQKTIANSVFSLLGSTEYEDITQIVIQDEFVVSDCSNFFKGLENVVSIEGMENINSTSNVDCTSMFEGCSSLMSIDLSSFDTDYVKNADKMFKDCSSLSLIESLEFSSKSLLTMSEMFCGCSNLSLLDLSKWDLTNVTNTFGCFDNSSFLYLRSPKVMPSKESCVFNFSFPIISEETKYYDLSFNTYEKLTKADASILIISNVGKSVLDSTCNKFIKDCDYYCKADGSTSEASLIKLWKNQSEDFADHIVGTINECLMDYFSQDNSLSPDLILKSFCERYDYIYGKYHTLLNEHGGDFANRSELIEFKDVSPTKLFNNETKDSANIVLIVVSATSLSILLFCIYLKKRNSYRK